jgi:hypothetical protein
MGLNALYNNTTANNNTALGQSTLYSSTTAANNVAIGLNAMYANTTGADNVAIGTYTLDANTTSSNNVGVGYHVLTQQITGTENVSVGAYSTDALTYGSRNTAVGTSALGNLDHANSSGGEASDNCAFGRNSLKNATSANNCIAIGAESGTDAVFNATTESSRLVLGNNSITNAYIKVSLTVTSDQRDKTEIEDLTQGLSFVNQLRPVSFKFNKSREEPTVAVGNKRYGFLAQEVLALEGSDPVIIDNENTENLKYQGEALVPVLVKAVQELKAELDAAKTRIATLEAG